MTTLMKDSGIDWIGKVSEGWKVKRLKDICKITRGGSPRPIQDYLTTNNENSIPWIKISDATKVKKIIVETENFIINKGATNGNTVYKGELIVSNSASPGIPRFVSQKSCVHDGWLILRKFDKNIDKNFMFYLIETIRNDLKNEGSGTIFINLSIEILSNKAVRFPPLETQKKIADYLDVEVSRLDKQVSLLERKYALLGDYKEALIFETVTQGLDKAVPMKDSGIDWIGEIPEEWRIKRVKDIFNIGRGVVIAASELKKEPDEKNIYPVYSSATEKNGVIGYLEDYKFDEDLITWTTDGVNAGTIFKRSGKFNCTNVCGTLKAKEKKKINLNYFKFMLISQTRFYKRPDINGAKIMNNEMARIIVSVPPLETQQKIADYLDVEVEKLDKQRELIKRKVELLKEYKEALIFEVVTGKKEVK